MNPKGKAFSQTEKSAREVAVDYGFDMSLIELNLQLTPEERCLQHDRAMNLAMKIRKTSQSQIDGLPEATQATQFPQS